MTTDEATRKLELFGIPNGGDEAEKVRGLLAQLLAYRAVSLGELQTARDVVERRPAAGPHAYIFLAAMFASLRDGNTVFNPGREENLGGGLLADACRRREGDEEAPESTSALRAAVAAEWGAAVAAADLLKGDIVGRDDRGYWYFARFGAAFQEVGDAFKNRIGGSGDTLSDAELDAVSTYLRRQEDGSVKGEPLDANQKKAVRAAVENRFTVVTGGPGTGKTTILCSVLRALFRKTGLTPADVALAAPTARAAQRMSEALAGQCASAVKCDPADEDTCAEISKLEGKTVHRLLEGYAPNWRFTAENPLPHRLVVVDECSMVDLLLMRTLLSALRTDCRLVLLGDRNQLPSVDAGAVLGDLTTICKEDLTGRGALVELTKSHRFSEDGLLKKCADEFNRRESASILKSRLPRTGDGKWTDVLADKGTEDGCFFYELAKPAKKDGKFREGVDALLLEWAEANGLGKKGELAALADKVARLDKPVREWTEADLHDLFRKLDESRILTVVRKGPFGVRHVNDLLVDNRLGRNPPEPLVKGGIPVIVTKNTPSLKLFNGDVGVTVKRGDDVYAVFPRGTEVVSCPVALLPEHELAYAITVHKSQGSEYGNVLVVLPDDETHPLLKCQLIYTGITRAKKRAVILGTQKALEAAIREEIKRDTGIVLAAARQ